VIRSRALAVTAGASILLAAAGAGREALRLGWSEASGLKYLQQEVDRHVSERERAVEANAQRVARRPDLVAAAAATGGDPQLELFSLLDDSSDDQGSIATTVWTPHGPAHGFKVLAWSGGPAENVSADLLNRASAFAVVPGVAGLRLIYVEPVVKGESRVGVAVAETVISTPMAFSTIPPTYKVETAVGPLPVTPVTSESSTLSVSSDFTIADRTGSLLLQVTVPRPLLANAQRIAHWRAASLALLPWLVWVAFVAASVLRRREPSRGWGVWFLQSLAGAALIALIAVIVVGLVRRVGLPDVWVHLARAIAGLAIVAAIPGSAWWLRLRRPSRRDAIVRWMAEHLAGGLVLAAGLAAMAWLWRDRIDPTALEKWQLPVLASDVVSVAAIAAVLLAQVAIAWAIGGVLGVLAARWRMHWRSPSGWLAVLLWMVPLTLIPVLSPTPVPAVGIVIIGTSAALFGLTATMLRRQYRVTSEARRLVLRFGSLFVPFLVAYPLASALAERTTREVIETTYGPATVAARQLDALMGTMGQAQKEIDLVPNLAALARRGEAKVSSQAAFLAWNQTTLFRDRVTSEIELYDADRRLTSRFALNVPEFSSLYQDGEQAWQGRGCEWATFSEVQRFGAEERSMLHAERGICADGVFQGAVVVHIVPDYRALLFVSSANPYYDVLSVDAQQRRPRIADLQLVVYGWSLQPIFTSGRVSWPIDKETDQALTESRQAFWRDREAAGRQYHIYFLNDRAGVYALGYPSPTALQHVMRLAEAAAVLMGVFVLYLAGVTALAPFGRTQTTAFPRLFREIRASFYRKLFLFFVLAAVGPVLLFAIAFGAYMTDKLRADVESEAGTVAVVARRVFDELSAAQARPGQGRLGPSDDVMVWIRQVVDQDVNFYEGPQLMATSQRDLFQSGLLPVRTPASVYREVVLGRRPVSVTEDRIGSFKYLVAAAPVPGLGREAILTVPLGLRQREIEREIDDLTRGVLAGTVVLVLFAALLGASVAARVSDPVARLTRATRQIAAGRLDERLVADSPDEIGRLVDDFNTMAETLVAQRAELARANQLKAWAEMSRQVAHEVKNPLTPIQLAAEHLQRVHEDQRRPLGATFDRCVSTILKQVRLLRQIAAEFSTFASHPTPKLEPVLLTELVESVLSPYRPGLPSRVTLEVAPLEHLPAVVADRTLFTRALTNLVENALQAMPAGGTLRVRGTATDGRVTLEIEDTGVGMDAEGTRRAFEPYFSTKTGGSGLGLANAKRNIELCGGSVSLSSRAGIGTTVTIALTAAPRVAPAAS
jgi:signal transduction histidine kinase